MYAFGDALVKSDQHPLTILEVKTSPEGLESGLQCLIDVGVVCSRQTRLRKDAAINRRHGQMVASRMIRHRPQKTKRIRACLTP
jgi:hypothetical protein